MPDYICNPDNFLDQLEQAQDGDTLYFIPNEYKLNNFRISKKIKLIGISRSTVLYATDEPVFTICVEGVKLETLRVERTVDGRKETVAIATLEGITYELQNVTVLGEAIGAIRYGEGIWQLPAAIDFGHIAPDRQERREIHLTVAEDCTVSSSLVGLAFSPETLSPGSHILHLELSTGGKLPGTRLHGFLQLEAQKHAQSIAITGEVAHSTTTLKSASPINTSNSVKSQVLTEITNLAIAAPIVREDKKVWLAYLEIQERIARQKQFCVAYESHNYGIATRTITFQLNIATATLDDITPLDAGTLWQRLKNARREEIRLVKSPADSEASEVPTISENVEGLAKLSLKLQDSEPLGTIEDCDPARKIVKISLDQGLTERITKGRHALPKTGYLYFTLRGDLVQIERQQQGLRDLGQGKCKNPRLPKFIFNASRAGLPKTQIRLQPQALLLGACNSDQILAVEKALSADDLVLIQGPPGTGKTTVIAEICYQVARRGGRTLIASQANLAVDNALSRLIHNPIIRALRKGRSSSIEEEGLPFVEEQVIQTWMKNTAKDCTQQLSDRRNNIIQFQGLLAPSVQFNQYLDLEVNSRSEVERLKAEISTYKIQVEQHEGNRLAKKAKYDQLKQALADVAGLLSGATPLDSSEAESVYESIISKLQNQHELSQAEVEVTLAIQKSFALGLTPPENCHWLIALQWLNNIIAENHSHWLEIQKILEEIQKLLYQVVDTENKEHALLLKIRSWSLD